MNGPARTESDRLRTVRHIYSRRQEATEATGRWFLLYVIALLLGIYVVPTAYLIGTSLDAATATALTGDGALMVINAVLCLLSALGFLLGTGQGPAYLTPFLAHTLLSGDFERRRVLLRPTLGMMTSVAAAVVGATAIAGFSVLQTGVWGPGHFWLLLSGSLFTGFHCGLFWFLGQRWAAVPRSTAAGLLVCLALTVFAAAPLVVPRAIWFSPGGWFALLWTEQALGAALAVSGAVAVVGVALMMLIPSALGGMPARTLIAQSRRTAHARLYSSTGSFDDAAELFRDRPRHRGHALMRWAVRGPATGLRGAFSGFVADLAAATRTPRRLVLGFSSMVLGVLLVSLCLGAAGPGSAQEEDLLLILVPATLLGTALLHLGSGAVADGWRSLKDEFDAAPLFGWAARQATLRRLAWPCAAGLVAVGLGHLAAQTASWWFGKHSGTTIGWSAVLAGIVLSARFMQTMRDRQMPLDSLVPIPTPFGDLSGLKVLFWVAEGLVVSLTAALGMLLLPWAWWALLLTSAACLAVAVATGWSRTGQAWSTGAPRSRFMEHEDSR